MANVEKWSHLIMTLKWGKGFMEEIKVDTAIMDEDVQCLHCGRGIKKGKMVFCASRLGSFPSLNGDRGWGDPRKPTFCSSNHAKLFVKNNNGL